MNKRLILNKDDRYIEICELPEGDLAGKTKIRMSALKIHENNLEYNSNGITWIEEYVEANLDSMIGSPYVVSWLDEENQIPSDHGAMSFDEEGNVIFDGVAVGAVQDAFIDIVEIDGVDTKVLMTEGYIFTQRYNKFVEWLKSEVENGKVYGSVEINGKGKSKTIEYLDGGTDDEGNLKNGRVPTEFDFTALAILYIADPADKNSIVFEVNTKEGDLSDMKVILKARNVEINKLSYNDIAEMVCRAFAEAMGLSYYDDFRICKFYPTSSEIVFCFWDKPGVYYMTSYSIENTTVKLGNIVQVEEDWVPVSGAEPVEVNISRGGNKRIMDEKKELQEKISILSKEIGEINAKVEGLNTTIEEKDVKIAELNEALVTANKSLEELSAKYEELEIERNTYKEEKEKMDREKLQAEVNAYFKEEIPKNKFAQEEIDSLKEYVEKCDLEGLKNAEANLIVKKYKEKVSEVVTNTAKDEDLFFSTKEDDDTDIIGKEYF